MADLAPSPPPQTGAPIEPGSLTYGVLTQRNDEYDDKRIERIDDLYVGGWQIQKKADKYLFKLPNEGDERYQARLKTATYQPHFGQIVDQFAADVFEQNLTIAPPADADDKGTPGKPPDVPDFYVEFAKDADNQGTSFEDVLKPLLTTALKHKRAILCVDAPAPNKEPRNRAEEEAQGLDRFYVYELNPRNLVDWAIDDDGNLSWAIVQKKDKPRKGPTATRDLVVESFTVWEMSGATAAWTRYEISYKETEPPQADRLVPKVDAGVTSFDAIPLHFLEVPDGLWVGSKIGPQALEHWRRRSSLIGAEDTSLVAIPWVALGPQASEAGGPVLAEIAEDQGRGKAPVSQARRRGFVELASGDSLDFAEPKGTCYELVDKQLDKLRDEMFAVNHQMAASVRTNTTALGRSGMSKQADQSSTQKVNGALGHLVREFALQLYKCISKARGDSDVLWAAHGMENYEKVDREQLLEEAVALDPVSEAIGSPTFSKLHRANLARKLSPNATPAEFAVMVKEINDSVEQKHEIIDLQQDAKKDEILNPQPPMIPQAPNGKPPMPPKQPQAKAPKQPGA